MYIFSREEIDFKKTKVILFQLLLFEFIGLSLLVINKNFFFYFLGPLLFLIFVGFLYKYDSYSLIFLIFFLLFGKISSLPFGKKIPGVYFVDILLLIITLVDFIKHKTYDPNYLSFNSTEKLFLFYIIWSFISVFCSIDVLRGLAYLRYMISCWLVFFFTNRWIIGEEKKKRLLNFFLLWGLFLAIMQIIYLLTRPNILISIVTKDINLFIGESNYIAAFFVMLIPICFSKCIDVRLIHQKISYILLAILFITCLFLTTSRGGIVGFTVGSLFWIFYERTRKVVIKLLVLFLITFIIVYFSCNLNELYKGLSVLERSASVMSRLKTWEESIRIFIHHPLLGVGLGNMHYYVQNFLVKQTGNFRLVKSHNLVLELMVETGLLGLIFFTLLLVNIIKYQIRNIFVNNNKNIQTMYFSLFVANVSALIHSLFEPTILTYLFGIFYWILMSISTTSSK